MLFAGFDITQNLTRFLTPPGLFSLPILWQIVLSWVSILRFCFGVELEYWLTALITIATGLLGPQDWLSTTGQFRRD
ncbi:hypothetical protein BJ878DRAFT_484626, partial [Calycina marina]